MEDLLGELVGDVEGLERWVMAPWINEDEQIITGSFSDRDRKSRYHRFLYVREVEVFLCSGGEVAVFLCSGGGSVSFWPFPDRDV